MFCPRNFDTLMRNMRATSTFYETNEFDVSHGVKSETDEQYRWISDEVATHHTTEELYVGILQLDRCCLPDGGRRRVRVRPLSG